MLAGKRAVRVGDHLLKEIALLLLNKVRDPRVKGVTVTGVRLSDDLKMAKVFYSVMGGKDQVKGAQVGLDSAKGFIKREIGRRLALRYMPDIMFVHDPSLQTGTYMDRVFEEIRKAEGRD